MPDPSFAPLPAEPLAWPPWPQLTDRALGAYLGLAIGDALGATVEFMTPREIAHAYAARGGVHRDIIGGGWLHLKAGDVTDDTTMSLALGDALLRGQALDRPFDMRLVAESFARWWRGKPPDCGNTCRRGIARFLRDGSLEAPPSPGDGGNGALMRNLPVALATLDSADAFARLSIAQARITHHHPLSDAAVLGIGGLLRQLLAGAEQRAARAWIDDWVSHQAVFGFVPYRGRASGFVVDTVQTVLHHFFAHASFEDAVIATVNRGDDADTTGALVGMLAGARCGAAALPKRWLSRLDRSIVRRVGEQTTALLALTRDRFASR